jgi:hypothetical protein
MALASNTSVA